MLELTSSIQSVTICSVNLFFRLQLSDTFDIVKLGTTARIKLRFGIGREVKFPVPVWTSIPTFPGVKHMYDFVDEYTDHTLINHFDECLAIGADIGIWQFRNPSDEETWTYIDGFIIDGVCEANQTESGVVTLLYGFVANSLCGEEIHAFEGDGAVLSSTVFALAVIDLLESIQYTGSVCAVGEERIVVVGDVG